MNVRLLSILNHSVYDIIHDFVGLRAQHVTTLEMHLNDYKELVALKMPIANETLANQPLYPLT